MLWNNIFRLAGDTKTGCRGDPCGKSRLYGDMRGGQATAVTQCGECALRTEHKERSPAKMLWNNIFRLAGDTKTGCRGDPCGKSRLYGDMRGGQATAVTQCGECALRTEHKERSPAKML